MGRPVNRDFGSRQRVRIVSGDSENHPQVDDVHGPQMRNVTASGATAVIDAPGAGFYICVTSIWLSNNDSSSARVLMRNGSSGSVGFGGRLAAGGGGVAMRFTPPWQLDEDTGLYADLTEGPGDVDVNINFYVE